MGRFFREQLHSQIWDSCGYDGAPIRYRFDLKNCANVNGDIDESASKEAANAWMEHIFYFPTPMKSLNGWGAVDRKGMKPLNYQSFPT